jgi:hypothetical protein
MDESPIKSYSSDADGIWVRLHSGELCGPYATAYEARVDIEPPEWFDGSPGYGCCDNPRIVSSRLTGEAHCGNCGGF